MKMELKKEIEKIAKGNGVFYPSDIVEKLNVPYDEVMKALNELKRDGLIAGG